MIWLSTIVAWPNDEGPNERRSPVAHSILVMISSLLRNQTTSQEKGETFFEEQERQGAEKRLVRQLSRLGYHVELQPVALAG